MFDIGEDEEKAVSEMLAAGKLPRPDELSAKILKNAGVKFQGPDKVVKVKLPEGWSIVRTESRHGHLLDSRGRLRADFFWNPRECRGYTRARARYAIYNNIIGSGWWAVDAATGEVLSRFNTRADPLSDERYDQAERWLDENFPGWKDASLYWDDPPSRRWWQIWRS